MSATSFLQFNWPPVAQVYAEAAYPLGVENHGFADPAVEQEYDRYMKICRFFFPFKGEFSEARKIVKRDGTDQDLADLERAVEDHYTTHLAFLPGRKKYDSIQDMGSKYAKKMRELKKDTGIAENLWDQGFQAWQSQNRRRIPGWIRV